MSRLWVRAIRKHRIERQALADCTWFSARAALQEALHELDAPSPMWLPKHEREFTDFRRTAFTKSHFVEDVPFDRLEIEFLDDEDVVHKSHDPRNDFD